LFGPALWAQDSTYVLPLPDSLTVASITLSGNKKTKAYVIMREMAFRVGERIASDELEARLLQSRTQINNTSLFGEYQLRDSVLAIDQLHLSLDVTERWYFFPAPVFELADRNLNVWIDQFNADINRVNFGLNPTFYNLTGHKDDLEGILQWGFTPKIELDYRRPYVGKSENNGIGFFASYSLNRQVPYLTADNLEQFEVFDDFALRRFRAAARYFRRNGLYQFHTVELKFNRHRISDSLASLNPTFFGQGRTQQDFISIGYTWLYDRVDARAYPLRGRYTELSAEKVGLGLFGDMDQWIILLRHNEYFSLPAKFFGGVQVIGKTALAREHPYFTIEGLGYCEELVRGYELYVIDGQHYGMVKTNLKHRLFGFSMANPLRSGKGFGRIPFDFYLKGYVDAGYVRDAVYEQGNSLTNEWLMGYGLGLDVVTFYDWVFRFEYSFNRLGENGLFLRWALDLDTYENCPVW
jgi:outer membrane protein assembly factor BamA